MFCYVCSVEFFCSNFVFCFHFFHPYFFHYDILLFVLRPHLLLCRLLVLLDHLGLILVLFLFLSLVLLLHDLLLSLFLSLYLLLIHTSLLPSSFADTVRGKPFSAGVGWSGVGVGVDGVFGVHSLASESGALECLPRQEGAPRGALPRRRRRATY